MKLVSSLKKALKISSVAFFVAVGFFTLILSFPNFSQAQDLGLLGPVDEFTQDELAVFRSSPSRHTKGIPVGTTPTDGIVVTPTSGGSGSSVIDFSATTGSGSGSGSSSGSGVNFADLWDPNSAANQNAANGGPTVNDEEIRCAAWQLIRLFEGNFGALIMIASGIGAIIGSAMGMFRTASALMVVAVSGFLVRGMVLIFFDLGNPSAECAPRLEVPGAAIAPQ